MKKKIAIIGLGYVGLPLAVNLSKFYEVVGYDLDSKRIEDLNLRIDKTLEVPKNKILNKNIIYTCLKSKLDDCNIYIVTVPTPIDKNNQPDISALKKASKMVGSKLNVGNLVIYESTVYPGLTEEICIPILERNSNLKCHNNKNLSKKNIFHVGYSPERINPGDKINNIKKVIKLISGSSQKSCKLTRSVYKSILGKNIFICSSIKEAEASKIIENVQRDVNIALINEYKEFLDKIDIDIFKVLKAAKTKWNFLNFEPGLVGGHCVSVDPYYLLKKYKELNLKSKVILSARQINENVVNSICNKVNIFLNGIEKKKILICGLTFKENCPDFRNSKAIKIFEKLNKKKTSIDLYDPYISFYNSYKEHHIKKIRKKYDLILFLVKHKEFFNLRPKSLEKHLKKNSYILDYKRIFDLKGRIKYI